MNEFANEFPNIDKTDLNKVWGILSNLQNNNPQKYKKFMGKETVPLFFNQALFRSYPSVSKEDD